jgi:protein TonB
MDAVISFGLQAAVLGIAVLAPLLYTEALPLTGLKILVELPPPPPRAPVPQTPQVRPRQATTVVETAVFQPRSVPRRIDQSPEPAAEPLSDPIGVIGAPMGDPRGSQLFNNLLSATAHHAAPVASIHPQSVRVSRGVIAGLLTYQVTPVYPALARSARIQGQVVLQAKISPQGTIENLQAISGHPMLIPSALDAVKQWRYRPYLLDNQPVEVETQITVNFNLGG